MSIITVDALSRDTEKPKRHNTVAVNRRPRRRYSKPTVTSEAEHESVMVITSRAVGGYVESKIEYLDGNNNPDKGSNKMSKITVDAATIPGGDKSAFTTTVHMGSSNTNTHVPVPLVVRSGSNLYTVVKDGIVSYTDKKDDSVRYEDHETKHLWLDEVERRKAKRIADDTAEHIAKINDAIATDKVSEFKGDLKPGIVIDDSALCITINELKGMDIALRIRETIADEGVSLRKVEHHAYIMNGVETISTFNDRDDIDVITLLGLTDNVVSFSRQLNKIKQHFGAGSLTYKRFHSVLTRVTNDFVRGSLGTGITIDSVENDLGDLVSHLEHNEPLSLKAFLEHYVEYVRSSMLEWVDQSDGESSDLVGRVGIIRLNLPSDELGYSISANQGWGMVYDYITPELHALITTAFERTGAPNLGIVTADGEYAQVVKVVDTSLHPLRGATPYALIPKA